MQKDPQMRRGACGYPVSNGCVNLLSLSACLFKGSKPNRKSGNINYDVVCGRRAGFYIV